MKKKCLIASLGFIAITTLFLFFFISKPNPGLLRFSFPKSPGNKKAGYDFEGIDIKKDDTKLCIGKMNEYTTIPGMPIETMNSPDPIRLSPKLTGSYIIDFFYLLKSKLNKPTQAVLKQTDKKGKEIAVFALNAEESIGINEISRYQKKLELEKDDIITISSGNADFGFISEPAFYKEEKKKPHFVFIIVADTMRWDFLGAYNKTKKCSPCIDRFAKDAAVFNHAYSTAPWTLPAHASMFTGLFPNKHQANYHNKDILRSNKILFDVLQQKFRIYGITDSHFVSAEFGFHQGFDFYNEFKKAYNDKTASIRTFRRARKMIISEKSSHALFFLHSYQVHSPYKPEIDLARKYYSKCNIMPGLFKFNAGQFLNQGKDLYKKLPEKERLDIQHVYEAGIYTFDHRFGQFISFLKNQNIYRDSLIILLSDHGEEFMDHGAWEHGHSLYNELIKIPLLIKFPGNRFAGQEVNDLASIADILPTIMDIEDVKMDESIAKNLDGISLVPAANGEKKKERKIVSCLAAKVMRKMNLKIAVISGNLKFIYYDKMNTKDREFFSFPPPSFDNEMFDIFLDPADKNNIILEEPLKTRELLDFSKKVKVKSVKKKVPEKLMDDLKTLGYL
ncbi:MAG: sulfatase [Acidobacteria bacterium]|nr:sulfatase [Acidobacteriota bacterium]